MHDEAPSSSMDQVRPSATESHKKRRAWYLLALVLFLLSLVAQQPLIFLAAFFSLVVGIVPGYWHRHVLRHLVVRQQIIPQHLFFGEEIVLSVSIENQKLLPVSWLRFENAITPILTILAKHSSQRETISQVENMSVLWSFQRLTRRYRMRCYSRGSYIIGPVTLHSSDPFGWLECELTIPLHTTFLVYPLLVPPEALGLPSLHPFGEDATSRRLLEDPLRVIGVRDYQLGDDPRRIHWKATAHAGTLRSKIYDYSNQRRILLLLDTWNHSKAWMGIDREIQEMTISVTASLAVWGLDEGYMVGLLANCAMMIATSEHFVAGQTVTPQAPGSSNKSRTIEISSPGVSVPCASDQRQYEQLLSMFSRLVPYNTVPIETIIDREDTMFSAGTIVILVSAATTVSQASIERLLDMSASVIATHLVLTGDQEDKIAVETYNLPVYNAGGREKWHELIQTFGEQRGQAIGTELVQFQLD